MFNIIIIGGMAAGCKAAARLSRLSNQYRITIIEKSPFVSLSRCGLPLYASGEIDDIFELTKTPYGIKRDEKFFQDFEGITVLTHTEAVNVDPWKKELECFDRRKEQSFKLEYDALLFATGSSPEEPVFPYFESSRISFLYSPEEIIKFKELIKLGLVKKVAIIGGGDYAWMYAESLVSLWGIEVINISDYDSDLNDIFDREFSKYLSNSVDSDKILTLLSTQVKRIEPDSNNLPIVILDNDQKIVSDFVILSPNLKPETSLAEKIDIKLGSSRGILIDEKLRTNIPGIWAAGDCTEIKNIVTGKGIHFPDGSLANRMGRSAADSISGRRIEFKGTTKTKCYKIFDNNYCKSGLTENEAAAQGFNTASVIGIWSDRADFDPEVKNIFGKLVYQKPGLRLLGLQLIGEGDILRYIDLFSVLLKEKRTLKSLLCIEHAFHPSHSTALSPLNYLGNMAINQEKDGVINFNPLNLHQFKGTFIDVREKHDADSKPLPIAAKNIPFSILRTTLDEFEQDEEILFICTKGGRSYESARLLKNNGFQKTAYLGGGSLLLNQVYDLSKYGELVS